jgi:hypothetical protein
VKQHRTPEPDALREALHALAILKLWPEHRARMRAQVPRWEERLILLPAVHGRMIVPEDGSYFLTWLRTWGEPIAEAPREADWRRTEGRLWVVDYVYVPGASGLATTRACARELIRRGVAAEGEIVYLWRGRSRRKGWIRARS